MSSNEYVQASAEPVDGAGYKQAEPKRRWVISGKLVLLVLSLVAFLVTAFAISHTGGVHVDFDGEQISGWQGFGFAMLALGAALLAIVLATVVVVVTMAGVSLMVLMLFTLIIGAVVLALSPVWLPIALLIAGMVWLLKQR